jgi:hypothetical protein
MNLKQMETVQQHEWVRLSYRYSQCPHCKGGRYKRVISGIEYHIHSNGSVKVVYEEPPCITRTKQFEDKTPRLRQGGSINMSSIMTNSPFSAKVGKFIPMEEISKLIQAHRTESVGQVDSFFVGIDKVQELLDQPNAVGLRIHLGLSEEGFTKLIIFPADENGNDIPVDFDGGTGGLDFMLPCPPYCSGE